MATVTYSLRIKNWQTQDIRTFENQQDAVGYAHEQALDWVISHPHHTYTFMLSIPPATENTLVYSVWDATNRNVAKYTVEWE